ncbi:4-hydroxybenzoate polyprenyltransferase, mitochondrial-like protein [Sarcoptes scabiei]|uniref:4-hydroxybenzoate polyprenyltransferase, mitochondrial n=1 Tax=Sarcoptes scabiei TaxID=52283 RepID=A0A132A7K1_SARSC|nr:4-hydroxybenzoate polyprenyltransferase, mitochondrial-like protein [Sarcoptes scabiei]
MRLDKPTGTWLLIFPCWWSIAMSTAAGSLPSLTNLGLFSIGAIMMRSAGCIINDIWDRKLDRKITRTKNRPLASNQIDLSESLALLSGLLGSSLLVLLQFDKYSVLLGSSSLALVSTYPLFKRFTYWPQLILGMTFNWGALLGWSVNCHGSIDLLAVLPLYAAGICWTLIYDTIYAHQDKKDDIMLGLKSTAIKFGDQTSTFLQGFTALMTISLLSCGIHTEQTWPYYLSLLMIFGNLQRIIYKLDINSVENCAENFRRNTQIGWILLFGLIIGTLCKSDSKTDQKIVSKSNPSTHQFLIDLFKIEKNQPRTSYSDAE